MDLLLSWLIVRCIKINNFVRLTQQVYITGEIYESLKRKLRESYIYQLFYRNDKFPISKNLKIFPFFFFLHKYKFSSTYI